MEFGALIIFPIFAHVFQKLVRLIALAEMQVLFFYLSSIIPNIINKAITPPLKVAAMDLPSCR
jgi:hypothetical protein